MKQVTVSRGDPGHGEYIRVLRGLSPKKRLELTFELTEFSRDLFLHGLKRRFPGKSEAEIQMIFLERIDKCHNANY
ncbi:MAG: hypothetical protein L6427_10605 [Actinomycetia bacterium]|nr:hypothetical protein [Actinomycetes bacterium]